MSEAPLVISHVSEDSLLPSSFLGLSTPFSVIGWLDNSYTVFSCRSFLVLINGQHIPYETVEL